MHFPSNLILSLAALSTLASARTNPHRRQSNTCILQTVSDPSTSDIQASINQWNVDVNTVNDYLNNVTTFSLGMDLQNQTGQAFMFAEDEPCQLQTLANIADLQGNLASDAYTCAIMDLMKVFQAHVLDNLVNIINNPSDKAIIDAAVNDINIFRCCNVLPDASILWRDAADDAGISNQVSISAGREVACSGITCTNVATATNCTNEQDF